MHSPDRESRNSNGSSNGDNYKDEPFSKDNDDREDFDNRKLRSPTTTSDSPPTSSSNNNSSNNNTSDSHDSQNKGNTLHVSNLNPKTRESDLRDTFAQYGKINECIILVDPNTKESRGFGFVTYSTSEEAQDAISRLDSYKLDGNIIRVEKSKRSKARDPTPGFYMGSERKKRSYHHNHHSHHGGHHNYHHRDQRGSSYPYPYPPNYSKYQPAMPATPYGGMGYYGSYGQYPPYPYNNSPTKNDRYSPYGRRDDRDRGRSDHHDRDRRDSDRGRERDYGYGRSRDSH